MGIKLEDLSEGICSTSYLSRIENNIVEVDDTYFEALCEKMNIDYNQIKVNRSRNIHLDLLKEYIGDNLTGVSKIVKHAIESNSYVDAELEMIVLFDNIINGIYDEARKILIKLEKISESFSNSELLFYMYCYTLYSYKTHQNKKAYQNIMVMSTVIYDDWFFEACVCDLALDIMAQVGDNTLWWKFYHKLLHSNANGLFRNRLNLHRLKEIELESHINMDSAISDFNDIINHLNLDRYDIGEKYYYHLAMCFFKNKQYDKAVNTIFMRKPSPRMTAILSSCILHLHNLDMINRIMDLLNKYEFNKYEKIYQDYYMLIKLMLEGNNNYVLYNYMRTILNNEDEFYDGFIDKEKRKVFIDILIGCSKYKEGLKFWKKTEELTLHDKLK